MKPPTSVKLQPSVEYRNTGRPTTNQTSREPNRKKRAADSQLMAGVLENTWVNFGLDFILPTPRGNSRAVTIRTASSRPASTASAPRKPIHSSNAAPTKNPAPLSAFLEPVNAATHWNSFDSPPSPATALTLAFADILFRSLAMPARAWAAIT